MPKKLLIRLVDERGFMRAGAYISLQMLKCWITLLLTPTKDDAPGHYKSAIWLDCSKQAYSEADKEKNKMGF